MTVVTQTAHALKERRDDLYETPECAVEALLAVESLPLHVWEPACGPGAIARVLRRHGHHVLGRVLINRQPNADLDVPPNVRYWGYVARLVSMSAKDPKRTLAFQNNILFYNRKT
jgi:hypothetical protein